MFLYMCSGNQKRVWGSSFSYDGTIRVVRILSSLMSTKFKKLSCHVIAARLSLCLKWTRFIDVSFYRGEGVLEPRTGSSHPRITSVTFCGASTQWLTPGRVEERAPVGKFPVGSVPWHCPHKYRKYLWCRHRALRSNCVACHHWSILLVLPTVKQLWHDSPDVQVVESDAAIGRLML